MDIIGEDKPKYHLQVMSGAFQLVMPLNDNREINEVADELLSKIKNGGVVLQNEEHSRFVFGPNTVIIVVTTEQFEKMQRMSQIAQPMMVPGMKKPS